MNIVYAVDDSFCRHLAVSMISLIEHNRNENLCFHILSDEISDENQRLLCNLCEDEGKEIHFYPIINLREQLMDKVYGMDTGHFRATILARLFMGSVLPETITKALYLDADTVVLRPLHKLYSVPLGAHVAAMAPEPTIYHELKKTLGIAENKPYFNSGVMLINLSLWRERGIEEDCFSFYNRMGGKLPFADQDILNVVLRGRILRLPQRFNFFSNYYYFRYKTLCKRAAWYSESESRESFFAAKHHPVIVHFAGAERPWIQGNRNHYKRAYRLYQSKTQYKDLPQLKGQRMAMLCYHIMNIFSFLLPSSRELLSVAYYRKRLRGMTKR